MFDSSNMSRGEIITTLKSILSRLEEKDIKPKVKKVKKTNKPKYLTARVVNNLRKNYYKYNQARRHYLWLIDMGYTSSNISEAMQSWVINNQLQDCYKAAGLPVPPKNSINVMWSMHRQGNDPNPLFRRFGNTMRLSAIV